MKKLIIATLLAVGVATPALAQSFSNDYGTGNVQAAPNGGISAYASAPHHPLHRMHR